MDLGGQISRLERHLFGVPERKRGLSVGEILAPKRGPSAQIPSSFLWIPALPGRARACPALPARAGSGRPRSKPFPPAPDFRKALVGRAQLPQTTTIPKKGL